MPTNLRFVSFLNETNTSMATLEWESPQSASRNYTIKISSKGVSVDEVFTTSSSINITLYYNTLYTISAIYTDCSLERSTSINVTVLKCQSPTSLPGVQVISPPVVSTEGSVLLYTCNHGNEVIRARCEDNYWYPNISCVQSKLVMIYINSQLHAREGYSSYCFYVSVCLCVCVSVCLCVCRSQTDFEDGYVLSLQTSIKAQQATV